MPVRRAVARALLRLTRWRLVGHLPASGVVVGAPHTSNWDFVLCILVLWADEVRPRVLVKQEIFRGPLGWLLRRLGAVPTERRGGSGLVDRLAAEAAADRRFALVLAAEGTRKRTDHWKSGFYRICQATGLPLTLAFVDGPSRTVGTGPTFHVTGDVAADMDRVRAFYADKHGLHPERAGTPRLREEGPAPEA